MNLNSKLRIGFVWNIEHIRKGVVIGTEPVCNLIPTEGLDHILSVLLKGGTQRLDWYIALFEGNYTPVAGLTAANFVANATECTAYIEATREAWVGGAVSGGAVSNTNSKAEFTFNAIKTVYGGVLISSATKGSSTGEILSAVRFSTAKPMESGDILRIAAGITLVPV